MAYAMINDKRHLVRVTQDLADNYAIEVYPEPDPRAVKVAEPFKGWPTPLCMKVNANSREDALVCALEHMKKLGKITSFHVDESEKPKPAPAKTTAAKADAEEEAEE
jgi:hypothetical protein